jgi:hypothetical protein
MVGPEAMRYGLPVVAFNSGGIEEWLLHGENGFLVPWMDTTTFASRIRELLRNKELGRQMGQNGRDRVNRVYPAARQIESLEKLFMTVASKSKQRLTSVLSAHQVEPQFLPDFSALPASNCVEALTQPNAANV